MRFKKYTSNLVLRLVHTGSEVHYLYDMVRIDSTFESGPNKRANKSYYKTNNQEYLVSNRT